ncbi:MAG: RNA polymerase sigma factor [Clostridia bacterium]|nr:RNA polymerase sigma factor [Clostridia bacterium]
MGNDNLNYLRFCEYDDEQGLAEIIKAHNDGLILFIYSIVGNISVAEDIAEDTFVHLGVKKPKNKQKASFKTWLYTIARNKSIDYLRKQGRKNEISISEIGDICSGNDTVEAAYFGDERKRMIYMNLAKISSQYRNVLWLYYFEGFKCVEIAVLLKKSVHTVEMLLHRARKALKTELMKEGFIYEEL